MARYRTSFFPPVRAGLWHAVPRENLSREFASRQLLPHTLPLGERRYVQKLLCLVCSHLGKRCFLAETFTPGKKFRGGPPAEPATRYLAAWLLSRSAGRPRRRWPRRPIPHRPNRTPAGGFNGNVYMARLARPRHSPNQSDLRGLPTWKKISANRQRLSSQRAAATRGSCSTAGTLRKHCPFPYWGGYPVAGSASGPPSGFLPWA